MERSSTPLYDLQVDVHTLQRPALDKTSNPCFPAPLPVARIWERIRRWSIALTASESWASESTSKSSTTREKAVKKLAVTRAFLKEDILFACVLPCEAYQIGTCRQNSPRCEEGAGVGVGDLEDIKAVTRLLWR
jgi:hypothetical protein